MKVNLVSNVGGLNTDIVPYFLEYYHNLGIDNFIILFHIHEGNRDFLDSVSFLIEKYKISCYEIWEGPWSKKEKEKRLNKLVDNSGLFSDFDWAIAANQNEFQNYDCDVKTFFSEVCRKGYNSIIGNLFDQVASDFPSFPEITNSPDKIYMKHKKIIDKIQEGVCLKENVAYCVKADVLHPMPSPIKILHYNWDKSIFRRMIDFIKSEFIDNEDKVKAAKFMIRYLHLSGICGSEEKGCKVCRRVETFLIDKKWDKNYKETRYPIKKTDV